MKRQTAQWVRKAEEDLIGARALPFSNRPQGIWLLPCSRRGKSIFKCALQELGAAVPRTHDLQDLLDMLLPHDGSLAVLGRIAQSHEICRRASLSWCAERRRNKWRQPFETRSACEASAFATRPASLNTPSKARLSSPDFDLAEVGVRLVQPAHHHSNVHFYPPEYLD